jgi:hypothetical protein
MIQFSVKFVGERVHAEARRLKVSVSDFSASPRLRVSFVVLKLG